MDRSWLIGILILLGSPALRKISSWALAHVGRSMRWSPLSQTLPRLSWLAYPLSIQLLLQLASSKGSIPSVILHSQRPITALLYVAYVLIVLSWMREFAYSTLDWSTRKAEPSPILKTGFVPLIRNSVTLVVATLALILILQHFGFDVLSLVTALGVGSLAVGLAAKDTLSNMISGFTLIIDQNFQPGDRIAISGCSGEVEEIGLRSTRIRTQSGTRWIVPNAELVNTKILNLGTSTGSAQVATTLRISYESNFSKVAALVDSILKKCSTVDLSRSAQVTLQNLNDGAQTVGIQFWVRQPSQADSTLTQFLEIWLEESPRAGIRLSGASLSASTPVGIP